MNSLNLIFVGGVALYVGLAAVLDIRQHRVPNYLTVPAALLGLAWHTLAPGGWGLGASLAGFGVGFLLLLLPWLFGGGGMGDVKLLAALGAWLGPRLMLVAFALSIVSAAILAMGILVWAMITGSLTSPNRYRAAAKGGPDNQTETSAGVSPRGRRQRLLPFAVPVALSVWSMLAWMMIQRGL